MNNDYTFVFEEFIPDFFHFMLKEGGLARKTSRDYISRLKFLSDHYLLDENISEEYIADILEQENVKGTTEKLLFLGYLFGTPWFSLPYERLPDSLFIEFWGESVPKEKRIARWLEKADSLATNWVPSQTLFLKS